MYRVVRQYVGITLGAVITAVAMNMFLIPNKIAAGGISGLATVLYYLFGWPVGMTMLAFNIPVFFISLKLIGKRFGANTLVGAAILSLAIDLTAPYIPVLTQDVLLSSLYGGVLSGVGLGLVFRFKGSTGGTAMIAAIINKLFGTSVGQAMMGADFFVILFAGIAFKSADLSLYALISVFVTAQIVDLVLEGASSAKAFFIITTKPQEVSAELIHKIDRGVTFLHGRGAYTGQERDVVFCVVDTSQITSAKEIIYAIDKKAFVILTDAHEVLGEGFTPVAANNK